MRYCNHISETTLHATEGTPNGLIFPFDLGIYFLLITGLKSHEFVILPTSSRVSNILFFDDDLYQSFITWITHQTLNDLDPVSNFEKILKASLNSP